MGSLSYRLYAPSDLSGSALFSEVTLQDPLFHTSSNLSLVRTESDHSALSLPSFLHPVKIDGGYSVFKDQVIQNCRFHLTFLL